MWYLFTPETTLCICLSVLAVIVVVFVITADPMITVLVFLCVAMTDLFLFGHIHYMELTFNPLTSLNVIISMGISVDYSCHIAYAYLLEPIPKDGSCDTNKKIRHHKTKAALKKMGPSVFHGGFSTFVAIFALVVNKTYVGKVIFRLWFGMIFFGLANGFLLLPVLLSLIGPTHEVEEPSKAEEGK